MHQKGVRVSSWDFAVEIQPETNFAEHAVNGLSLKIRPARRVRGFRMSWSKAVALVFLFISVLHVPAEATVSVEAADDTAVTSIVLSALKLEAEREYEAIAAALGTGHGGTVQIVIAREFNGQQIEVSRSYPEASLIIIPPHVLTRRVVPLAHELTHIIAGRGATDVFSEGLAVYNQEMFGSDPAFPNFGRAIDIALRDAIMRRYEAKTWREAVRGFKLELVPTPDPTAVLSRWINDTHDIDRRTLAYLTAASYVGYLVDSFFKGDTKAFFPLYRTGNYARHRLDAEDAWSGWLKTLENG